MEQEPPPARLLSAQRGPPAPLCGVWPLGGGLSGEASYEGVSGAQAGGGGLWPPWPLAWTHGGVGSRSWGPQRWPQGCDVGAAL